MQCKVIGLTFKIKAIGGRQVAGDHGGHTFLLFLVVGCVFGVRVAVGCSESTIGSDDLNKNPTYIGFGLNYRLHFFLSILLLHK